MSLVVIRQGIRRILIEGPTVAVRFNHLGYDRLRPATVGHEVTLTGDVDRSIKRRLRSSKQLSDQRGGSTFIGNAIPDPAPHRCFGS
jgi:hypothetical protein